MNVHYQFRILPFIIQHGRHLSAAALLLLSRATSRSTFYRGRSPPCIYLLQIVSPNPPANAHPPSKFPAHERDMKVFNDTVGINFHYFPICISLLSHDCLLSHLTDARKYLNFNGLCRYCETPPPRRATVLHANLKLTPENVPRNLQCSLSFHKMSVIPDRQKSLLSCCYQLGGTRAENGHQVK